MFSNVILVALVCVAHSACTTCADSADIQLMLEVDATVGAQVTSLEVGITPAGGSRQVMPVSTPGGVSSGRTILLSPTTAPTGDRYSFVLDVTALHDTTVVAQGEQQIEAGTRACNRSSIALNGGASGDLGFVDLSVGDFPLVDLASEDRALPDFAKIPDLSSLDARMCTPASPDEDGDGIYDDCDVCAANADPLLTPSDGDGDGLPDVCDPNKLAGSNDKRLYFEPFNAPLVGWSGSASPSAGELVLSASSGISPLGGVVSMNAGVAFNPASVFIQTTFAITTATPGINGTVRAYLWKNTTTQGYRCQVRIGIDGTHYLELFDLGTSGPFGIALSAPLTLGQRYRMASFANAKQSPGFVGCELSTENGNFLASIKEEVTFASSDTVGMGVGVGFEPGGGVGDLVAHFSSLFATTYAP